MSPEKIAELPHGVTLFLNGMVVFVPKASTSRDIYATIEVLDDLANSKYEAELRLTPNNHRQPEKGGQT